MDTGKSCVVVFVQEKLPMEKLDANQIVPQFLPDNTKTDVIEVGDVRILPLVAEAATEVENRLRHRPVPGGASISPGILALSGTGGMIVYQGDIPCILSNVHVLRPPRLVGNPDIPTRGSPIRQPSLPDSGIWNGNYRKDDIGDLWDWVEVAFPGPNEVDCAIAKLTARYVPHILGLGGPIGVVEDPTRLWDAGSATWAKVWKSGRTSGITEGRITAINVTIQVDFGRGRTATFENQIAATAMMVAGDSGSVWITEGNQVAGLGFAGSTQMSFANLIGRVFELLRLTLPSPVTSIEDILPQLGETTLWGFNNETKGWDSYTTTVPERFRHFMRLRYLVPGNGYWIKVEKDLVLEHNEFRWKMFNGWNLIGFK
ncbi:MAG: hypothetical protein DDT32_02210 [Syntrophomonadaceae bacterium]|nr:hypothetical protein [Bacillota bacterium]